MSIDIPSMAGDKVLEKRGHVLEAREDGREEDALTRQILGDPDHDGIGLGIADEFIDVSDELTVERGLGEERPTGLEIGDEDIGEVAGGALIEDDLLMDGTRLVIILCLVDLLPIDGEAGFVGTNEEFLCGAIVAPHPEMDVFAEEGGGGDVGSHEMIIAGKEDGLATFESGELLGKRDGEEGLAGAGGHTITEQERGVAHDGVHDMIDDLDLLGVEAHATGSLFGEGGEHEFGMVLEELMKDLVAREEALREDEETREKGADGGIDLIGACDILALDAIEGDHGVDENATIGDGETEPDDALIEHDVPFSNHKGKGGLTAEGDEEGAEGLGVEADEIEILLDEAILGLPVDAIADGVGTLFRVLLGLVAAPTAGGGRCGCGRLFWDEK